VLGCREYGGPGSLTVTEGHADRTKTQMHSCRASAGGSRGCDRCGRSMAC
jgi:hypothetical protein